MLEEEDYPGAIQLCLECQKAASTFKHYSCIRSKKIKKNPLGVRPNLFFAAAREQLDVALSKTCKSFDINHYIKVQQAYTLLGKTQEQLDVALSKTCKSFDINHYIKVQQAYTLLGKTQTAIDQLHMHFTQAIHNTVFQVVLGYVELCAGNADTNFQKMQYKDLCTVRTYMTAFSDSLRN
ncbi:UNVERIFIED_CONTAM: hypothetical protein FKN15_076498 [Acipenser sinensis]